MARLILILILLNSCTCEYYLDRIEKKCGKTAFTDTLTVRDTIEVESVQTDTMFFYNQKDTVIIKEGRLTMKYFYNDSTVYLSGKCDTLFIPIEKKVPYTKYEVVYDLVSRFKWVIIGAFLLIFLALIWKLIK